MKLDASEERALATRTFGANEPFNARGTLYPKADLNIQSFQIVEATQLFFNFSPLIEVFLFGYFCLSLS